MKTVLTVPRPPSVNSCYGTNWKTKRRFKTKRYEQWLKLALWEVKLQRPGHHGGKVRVALYIERPFPEGSKRKVDVCNFEKPVTDMLVAAGVIADDSLIQKNAQEWAEVKGVRIEIEDV